MEPGEEVGVVRGFARAPARPRRTDCARAVECLVSHGMNSGEVAVGGAGNSRVRGEEAPDSPGIPRSASTRERIVVPSARLGRDLRLHIDPVVGFPLAVCASIGAACAPAAPRAPEPGPSFPAPARVLAVLHGRAGEHLGIALAALSDLDGDRKADLVLGSLRDARPSGAGPAFVRAVSGVSGRTVHEIRGGDAHGADAFGERLAIVGDVDGDQVNDFAVGAWRADGERGLLDVCSGKTGALLARVHGMPPWERFLGAAPSAAGDVDGDGSPDVAVSVNRSVTKVFGAKDGRLLAEFEGTPIALTGDLDGDGRNELLVFDGPPRDEAMLWTSSVRTARVVSTAKRATLQALDAGADLAQLEAHGSAGDLDRDGFVDWIVAGRPNDTEENDLVPGQRERRVRVISGKSGAVMSSFSVALPQRGRVHLAMGVGDLDGDGVGEVLVAGHVEEGLPAAFVELHSFPDGKLAHRFTSPNWSFGTSATPIPDQDGDGVADLVIGEYENSADERCAGRVYVIAIGRPTRP